MKSILVPPSCKEMRLDRAIAALFPTISRSQAEKLIERGEVLLNGLSVKKRISVSEGDRIELCESHERPSSLIPEPMDFSILYEDEVMFVINKPPGMVVHPACGHWEGTFAHGFLHRCASIESLDPLRPGIIHRLDKDTSGVLIAAKTAEAVRALSRQFQDRSVEKWYEAILVGEMKTPVDVRRPIGRHTKERKKMAVVDTGREAFSHFIPMKTTKALTYAKISIETGRTHQIRVHAASIGFPILGDPLYGMKESNAKWKVTRQMLHCSEITLLHPVSGKSMLFHAPLPTDMKELVDTL